jgi:hypothetical protein
MTYRRQLVGWKDLKVMGWPLSRAHTWRKMKATITVSRKGKDGDRVERVIPNPDRFPQCVKLGWHPNSPPVWRLADVRNYFGKHGLVLDGTDESP